MRMPKTLPDGSVYGLGDWMVYPDRACIERDGREIRLAPKALAVLQVLVRSAGQAVTRQQLFEEVWPGGVVSDEALTQRISELRKALGDSPRKPRYIETIPKVGFRLIAPVRVPGAANQNPPDAVRPAEPRRGRPGIPKAAFILLVVLPAVLAGAYAGHRIHLDLSEARFRRAVSGALVGGIRTHRGMGRFFEDNLQEAVDDVADVGLVGPPHRLPSLSKRANYSTMQVLVKQRVSDLEFSCVFLCCPRPAWLGHTSWF